MNYSDEFIVEDGILKGYKGINQSVEIPEYIYKIGKNAFKELEFIEKIKLHNGIIEIGEGAFYNCKHLKDINLHNSIKSIERKAFFGCHSLEALAIPCSIDTIYYRTFGECSSIERLFIPNNVKLLENKSFQFCSNLKELSLPYGIKVLGCPFSKEHGTIDVSFRIDGIRSISLHDLNDFDLNNVIYFLQNNHWKCADVASRVALPLLFQLYAYKLINEKQMISLRRFLALDNSSICYLLDCSIYIIKEIVYNSGFVNKENIDLLINKAVDMGYYDAKTMLIDYKFKCLF